MRRYLFWGAVLMALGLPLAAGGPEEDSIRTVKVEDRQGVVTYASDFGKAFGGGFLSAYRGDSRVEIPFERIATLRTGRVVDSRMGVEVTLTSGRGLEVQLDRPEFESVYGGLTDFGNFRIRLQEIRTLEFRTAENVTEDHAQRCGAGHIWYKDTWRYCPFDGKPLAALPRRDPGAEEPQPR